MDSCCNPTSAPRISGGLISALYIGTIMLRAPTPIPNISFSVIIIHPYLVKILPVMNRPPKMDEWPDDVTAVVCTTTPTIKTATLTRIAYFRERISARNPLYKVPNHAPSSRIEVSHPSLVWLEVYAPMSVSRALGNYSMQHSHRVKHTVFERGHCKHTTEYSLVVAIKQTPETGKASNTKNFDIFD
jgi:hypothetical protein